MRRSFSLLPLAAFAVIALAAPAGAQEAGDADSIGTIDNDAPAGAVVPMACKVVTGDGQGQAPGQTASGEVQARAETGPRVGVACQWRQADAPAKGYRLGRLELGGRKVIFRTADLSRHAFLDARVRPGLQYAYKLQVIGESGRVIGQSRFVLVLVHPGGNELNAPPQTTSTTAAPARQSPQGNGSQQLTQLREQLQRLQDQLRQRPTPSTTVPGGTSTQTARA